MVGIVLIICRGIWWMSKPLLLQVIWLWTLSIFKEDNLLHIYTKEVVLTRQLPREGGTHKPGPKKQKLTSNASQTAVLTVDPP